MAVPCAGGAAGARVRVNGTTDGTLWRDLGRPWWNLTHCDLTHLREGQTAPVSVTLESTSAKKDDIDCPLHAPFTPPPGEPAAGAGGATCHYVTISNPRNKWHATLEGGSGTLRVPESWGQALERTETSDRIQGGDPDFAGGLVG